MPLTLEEALNRTYTVRFNGQVKLPLCLVGRHVRLTVGQGFELERIVKARSDSGYVQLSKALKGLGVTVLYTVSD